MSKRRRTIKDEVENMNKTFTVINEAETHTDHKDESKQYTNTNQSASIGQIIIPVQAKNFNQDLQLENDPHKHTVNEPPKLG